MKSIKSNLLLGYLVLYSLGFSSLTQSPNAQAGSKLEIIKAHSGNPNGPDGVIIDPSGAGTLFLTLKNPSNTQMRNLVLNPVPGNCVTEMGGQIYQDQVAANQTFEGSPLYFKVNVQCPAGQALDFLLTGAFDNVTTGARESIWASGKINPQGQEFVYSNDSLNLAIPDASSVDLPIDVTSGNLIKDITIKVQANHPYPSDVKLTLIHPDGTRVIVTGSHQVVSGSVITINIGYEGVAYTPFNIFKGKPANGKWILKCEDVEKDDTGSIQKVTFKIK